MEIVFAKADLVDTLKVASSVAATRNTLPILANVKIAAEDEEVTIEASDLELGVRLVTKGQIVDPGSITAQAKKLYSLISAMPDTIKGEPAIVKFATAANDRLRITCGTGNYNMAGLPDEEFPELPDIKEGLSISSAALCSMLNKAAYATSEEETRRFLCGVYLTIEERLWSAVATDGRRLAVVKHEEEAAVSQPVDVIVPNKAVAGIVRTFSSTEDLRLEVRDNQILVANETMTLMSRLIEGEYPDYKAVMAPTLNNEITLRTDTERLIHVLRRVSLMANPKVPQVKFMAKEGQIHVSAETPEIGHAEEFMPCIIDGPIELAFNSEFMLDVLVNIETDQVVMKFKDSLSPVLIKESEGDSYVSVLMPMRL